MTYMSMKLNKEMPKISILSKEICVRIYSHGIWTDRRETERDSSFPKKISGFNTQRSLMCGTGEHETGEKQTPL